MTRRTFLTVCFCAANTPPPTEGPPFDGPDHQIRWRLVKEFPQFRREAVSPDGTRLCLVGQEKSSRESQHSKLPALVRSIRVVEIGTWKDIYSVSLRGDTGRFSFFSDGALYHESVGADLTLVTRSEVYPPDGGLAIKRETAWRSGESLRYTAAGGTGLVGVNDGMVVRVDWPDIDRQRAAVREDHSSPCEVSADGSRLIHFADQALVCRSTENLGVLWRRTLDQSVIHASLVREGARTAFAISGSGTRTALSVGCPICDGHPSPYTEILDSGNGKIINRLSVDQGEGIALSEDGAVLGVGRLVYRTDGHLERVAVLYSVYSGEAVGRVLHDSIPPGPTRDLHGGFSRGVSFTPGSGYLITTALQGTKVWEMVPA
jgi:hypothetical protein